MRALLTYALIATLCTGSTWADPGEHGHGHGREHGEERDEDRDRDRGHGFRFADRDRIVLRDYFGEQAAVGHCPPGLAKKHNGCMPPGQARKWMVGRPLPPEVVYYPLPPEVVVQLTPPPVGYRYVRVASDILMMATGTAMVVGALQDLGGH